MKYFGQINIGQHYQNQINHYCDITCRYFDARLIGDCKTRITASHSTCARNIQGVSPRVVASSGEVLRKMTLSGTGIACITDFMTKADRNSGKLIEVLKDQTIDEKREISAVCYRGTSSSIKVLSFIEFLKKELPSLL
jgi:DNA-binding transcriptional LysR family regulator